MVKTVRKDSIEAKRARAIERLMQLRKRTAKFTSREILAALRRDRARSH